MILLVVNLTYSALAGFALLVLSGPVIGKAMNSLFHRRLAINKITDRRVSLTQEILTAVRFVKYFGWEMSFLNRIGTYRSKEIHLVQMLMAIRNAINAIAMSMPVFASMLAFITFSLSKHVLNPAPIFSSLALFNSLRLPLNFLPLVISQVIDASASIKRMQQFLDAEEALDEAEVDYTLKEALVLNKASFTWERTPTQDNEKGDKKGRPGSGAKEEKPAKGKEPETAGPMTSNVPTNESASTLIDQIPFQISDLTFSVGRGELIAVIGGVGSGKSSLLAALAGDMRRTSGTVKLGASRAFCPQYAWIQNASVKENIIFGKEYNRDWYEKVVEVSIPLSFSCFQPLLDLHPGFSATLPQAASPTRKAFRTFSSSIPVAFLSFC